MVQISHSTYNNIYEMKVALVIKYKKYEKGKLEKDYK